MNVKAVLKYVVLAILVAILLNSIYKVATFSTDIDQSAATILTEQNKYYSWFYDVTEMNEDHVSVHYGMMGGNIELGTLNVTSDMSIDIDMKERSGQIKLLLVDDALEKEIYFNTILDKSKIKVKKGEYKVILVCSWFSGQCGLSFTDGSFSSLY